MAVIDGYIKKLKQDDIDRLNEWTELAWKTHWRELGSKSNSKAKFREYVFRDNKPADELLGILHAIRQQTAMWRKQSRIEKVMGIPHLSSWYNAGRWDDDISHDNLGAESPASELKQCSEVGCENEVHGSRFDKCTNHLVNEKHYNDLREAWTRTGIDRKSPTLGQDCRTYLRERMGIILSKGEI